MIDIVNILYKIGDTKDVIVAENVDAADYQTYANMIMNGTFVRDPNSVDLDLKSAARYYRSPDGFTLMELAIIYENVAAVYALLRHGKNYPTISCRAGNLYLAVAGRRRPGEEEECELNVAASKRRRSILLSLLSNGGLFDRKGILDALNLATSCGDLMLVELLKRVANNYGAGWSRERDAALHKLDADSYQTYIRQIIPVIASNNYKYYIDRGGETIPENKESMEYGLVLELIYAELLRTNYDEATILAFKILYVKIIDRGMFANAFTYTRHSCINLARFITYSHIQPDQPRKPYVGNPGCYVCRSWAGIAYEIYKHNRDGFVGVLGNINEIGPDGSYILMAALYDYSLRRDANFSPFKRLIADGLKNPYGPGLTANQIQLDDIAVISDDIIDLGDKLCKKLLRGRHVTALWNTLYIVFN